MLRDVEILQHQLPSQSERGLKLQFQKTRLWAEPIHLACCTTGGSVLNESRTSRAGPVD